VQTWANC